MSEIVIIKSENGSVTYVTGKVETKTKESLLEEIQEVKNSLNTEAMSVGQVEALFAQKKFDLEAKHTEELKSLEDEKLAAVQSAIEVADRAAELTEKLKQLEAVYKVLDPQQDEQVDALSGEKTDESDS